MILSYAHGREFVSQVRPFLENNDPDSLVREVAGRWPNPKLRAMLSCGYDDAAKSALACLSLTGTMEDVPEVADLLHDDDAYMAAFAEHALWSIWFRAGDDSGNNMLARAVHMISRNEIDQAIRLLDSLSVRCENFAEAHNQLAIAHFLKNDYAKSVYHCKEALRLNPYHFGAMAGLGHSQALLGCWKEALDAYQSALHLHPRLEGIRQSIRKIREWLLRHAADGSQHPATA